MPTRKAEPGENHHNRQLLGIGLAREGEKGSFWWDADPQGDLTTSLGWPEQDKPFCDNLPHSLEGIVADREMDSHAGILHHEEGV